MKREKKTRARENQDDREMARVSISIILEKEKKGTRIQGKGQNRENSKGTPTRRRISKRGDREETLEEWQKEEKRVAS